MLIGDKGQSGGRRWEVYGFPNLGFSYSPKVSRRVVVRFTDSVVLTGPRVRRVEVPDFPKLGFSGSPKVRRCDSADLPSGHF